ncbi:hypothetical protein XCR_2956 [Xanthomonas campestris pv. raphani 756C]|nr:hypothetical protein XCR_2956 [Xanthomonas campestris pv. raphani 756C]
MHSGIAGHLSLQMSAANECDGALTPDARERSRSLKERFL